MDGWPEVFEKTSATNQDDFLDVFGLTPVEHPSGVVFLDSLVHTLNLLVPRDEEGVVSNQRKPDRERNVTKKIIKRRLHE